jgi:hypothetical protein
MTKAHPHFSKVGHLKSRSQSSRTLNQKMNNNSQPSLNPEFLTWLSASVSTWLFINNHPVDF